MADMQRHLAREESQSTVPFPDFDVIKTESLAEGRRPLVSARPTDFPRNNFGEDKIDQNYISNQLFFRFLHIIRIYFALLFDLRIAMQSWRPVQLSLWLGLPLSLWMIIIAGQTFTRAPFGDGPDWPVLTSFRDPRSLLNILNHRSHTTPPWLYKGAKGITAMLWSILIPLQHSEYLRRWYPVLHRRSGYMVILLSTELAIAGYYMSSQGLVTTHPQWHHIHTLYNTRIPLPLLWWPTFNVAIVVLGIFYFFSLYKLYSSIRMKKIEAHRRWAVFHSMTGYAISIERFIAVLVLSFGWLLTQLPHFIQHKWLQLPRDIDGKLEVEVSALAWTLTAAGTTVAVWTYSEWTSAGLIGPVRRGTSANLDKQWNKK